VTIQNWVVRAKIGSKLTKIGQNLKFPMGKRDFQKIFKTLRLFAYWLNFHEKWHEGGLRDTKKVIGLHF
jgi:hypothetical protein